MGTPCVEEDCTNILLLLLDMFIDLPNGFFMFSTHRHLNCLPFLLFVSWTPGNKPILYHANNSCATNLFPSFSSLLPLSIQSPFSFLLAPGIYISFCYPFPILSSHSPCSKGFHYVPCPAYSLRHTTEASYPCFSLYFPLLFFLLSQ